MLKNATSLRRAALLACFAISSAPPVYAGFADRLATSAIQTPEAKNSLLLDVEKAGQRLIAVGEQGVVLLSDDSGAQWRQVSVPVRVLLTAVHFPTPEQGWIVGHDGVVLKTEDGGQSWQTVASAPDLNQLRVEQLEQVVAEAGDNPDLDPDQVETWEYALDDAIIAQEDGAMPPLLDVWFASENEGYLLGSYGQFYRTQDGGQSWQTQGHLLPNPDGFHLNKMTQLTDGTLYIAGEAGIAMLSKDGGSSWQAVDSPYDGSFFSVIEHERVYLMGLRGNMFSSDDSEQWQQVELPKKATLNAAVSNGEDLFLLGQGGLLLHKGDQGFEVFSEELKRSLVAGVISDGMLITVGSGGINRLSIEAGGSAQ